MSHAEVVWSAQLIITLQFQISSFGAHCIGCMILQHQMHVSGSCLVPWLYTAPVRLVCNVLPVSLVAAGIQEMEPLKSEAACNTKYAVCFGVISRMVPCGIIGCCVSCQVHY